MHTPYNATPPSLDRVEVTLPDGRATTIGAVLDEARRARGEAIAEALRAAPKHGRRWRLHLAALFAPVLGRTRQLDYRP